MLTLTVAGKVLALLSLLLVVLLWLLAVLYLLRMRSVRKEVTFLGGFGTCLIFCMIPSTSRQ